MDGSIEVLKALAAAKKDMEDAKLLGMHDFHGYKYPRLIDYLDVVRPALLKNGLEIVCSVTESEWLPDRGAEHAIQVKLLMTLYHVSGQSITIECPGQGQDKGDKAIYGAITGARKYGIACLFNLPATDDPEATGKTQEKKRIEDAKKRQTASSTQPKPRTTQPPIESSKPAEEGSSFSKTIKEMRGKCVEMYGKKEGAYAEGLKKLTNWWDDQGNLKKAGMTSLGEIKSDKQLFAIKKKVDEAYEKFTKGEDDGLPF